MVDRQVWGRLRLVGPDGDELGDCVVTGIGAPDLAAVDEVARFCLSASRVGGCAVFETVSAELLELVGLAGLRVDVRGEAEVSEQILDVE
jgi:hypothetical protein